ncbi:MAG: HEAT repeat domain-containing protein [Anaerolineales bacterium]
MSHSYGDAERAWDFGMVDDDVIAFPIVKVDDEIAWSLGSLDDAKSYWRSRDRVSWHAFDNINYVGVGEFRSVVHTRSATKGVVEGSETSISWDAIFSTRDGKVESTKNGKIPIRRSSDQHLYTWQNKKALPIVVVESESVRENQLIASDATPLSRKDLRCKNDLDRAHLLDLILSPERTQRFTGIKVARLISEASFEQNVQEAFAHPSEDMYVKMEGAIYLAKTCNHSIGDLLESHLGSADEQVQLESVVALSETGTDEAVAVLSAILDDNTSPYFIRSASAWALGKIGSEQAIERLIAAYSDLDDRVKEEALVSLRDLGNSATKHLMNGVQSEDPEIAAGSAEALRIQSDLSDDEVGELVSLVKADSGQIWPVWVLAHLPRERQVVQESITDLQQSNPSAHYAISLLWAFIDSWISSIWDRNPTP